MQNNVIKLHDIKPIVDVEEYSFYYLLGGTILVIFLALAITYLSLKWYKKRTKYNKRKDYFKQLKKLNLKESKKTAYGITFYGILFKDDSPRHSEMFKNITKRLEKYKYKKDVEPLDEDTLGYIELYKEMIDV